MAYQHRRPVVFPRGPLSPQVIRRWTLETLGVFRAFHFFFASSFKGGEEGAIGRASAEHNQAAQLELCHQVSNYTSSPSYTSTHTVAASPTDDLTKTRNYC